jgi:DnaK suppressor protein
MDTERARTLLAAERAEVESLLAETTGSTTQDQDAEQEVGDDVDVADALQAEAIDEALEARLRDRLAAVERAEQRLADGTYGVSVRSGDPIPDERLEVAPTAELTVEEAAAEESSGSS